MSENIGVATGKIMLKIVIALFKGCMECTDLRV